MSDRRGNQIPLGGLSSSSASSKQSQSAPSQDAWRYGQPPVARSPIAPASTPRRPQPTGPHGFDLPPLPPGPSAPSATFSPSPVRLAGVASILNPTYPEEPRPDRRRTASEMEDRSLLTQSLPPITSSAQPPQALAPRIEASHVFNGSSEQPSRRILTPRSPAGHRATSTSQIVPPNAGWGAQPTAIPPVRAYTVEPGTAGVPPMPRPPVATRSDHGLPMPTPLLDTGRRASPPPVRETELASASTSPTSSYSSYSRADRTSPATHYQLASSEYGPGTSAYGGDRQRSMGIPISSSGGQNVYQMMTLETSAGTVQLPVDIQAASRVADEKRRRNAGASARFRQRRKEKEKESSTTIGRLEQQAKNLAEQADFYKRERDYLAAVVLQVPGGDRHFPRPQSPRRRRSSGPPAGPNVAATASYGVPAHDMASRSPEQGRSVRRRTSTISLPPPPPPPAAVLQPQHVIYQPNYGPVIYGTPFAAPPQQLMQPATAPMPSPSVRSSLPPTPQPPGQQQPLLANHHQPLVGPPQLMHAPAQTGPWNPFASERRAPGPIGSSRDLR